jgi:hypothetical protein
LKSPTSFRWIVLYTVENWNLICVLLSPYTPFSESWFGLLCINIISKRIQRFKAK